MHGPTARCANTKPEQGKGRWGRGEVGPAADASPGLQPGRIQTVKPSLGGLIFSLHVHVHVHVHFVLLH